VQFEEEVFPIHSRITNNTAQNARKPLAPAYRSSRVLNLLLTATYTLLMTATYTLLLTATYTLLPTATYTLLPTATYTLLLTATYTFTVESPSVTVQFVQTGKPKDKRVL
jgi:hypothetical protein